MIVDSAAAAVRVWRLEDERLEEAVRIEEDASVEAVAFSGDGRQLAPVGMVGSVGPYPEALDIDSRRSQLEPRPFQDVAGEEAHDPARRRARHRAGQVRTHRDADPFLLPELFFFTAERFLAASPSPSPSPGKPASRKPASGIGPPSQPRSGFALRLSAWRRCSTLVPSAPWRSCNTLCRRFQSKATKFEFNVEKASQILEEYQRQLNDAKSEADRCCIREAIQRPTVTLWTNAYARRLITDPRRR